MTEEEKIKQFDEAIGYASAAILSNDDPLEALRAFDLPVEHVYAWGRSVTDPGVFALTLLTGMILERQRNF